MKFKVGDRVKFEEGMFKAVGEIVHIREREKCNYGVFSEALFSNENIISKRVTDNARKGDTTNCWWFSEDELELAKES